MKRFEIRISSKTGDASLDISGIGSIVASGDRETCAYVDVPAGRTHDAVISAREATRDGGVAPVVQIAEYGPSGPYWYETFAVSCQGPDGRCSRDAAEEWGRAIRQRKRGRIDPCGSAVIKGLGWSTAGGQGERDGGFFRDFAVRFSFEVKKFATQFAPGSTECVPK